MHVINSPVPFCSILRVRETQQFVRDLSTRQRRYDGSSAYGVGSRVVRRAPSKGVCQPDIRVLMRAGTGLYACSRAGWPRYTAVIALEPSAAMRLTHVASLGVRNAGVGGEFHDRDQFDL